VREDKLFPRCPLAELKSDGVICRIRARTQREEERRGEIAFAVKWNPPFFFFLAGLSPPASSAVTAWVVAGGRAELPCDILPEEPLERLAAVLWYREGSGEPIYT